MLRSFLEIIQGTLLQCISPGDFLEQGLQLFAIIHFQNFSQPASDGDEQSLERRLLYFIGTFPGRRKRVGSS